MKIKRSHRIIASFFIVSFLQTFFPYHVLANNNGPISPEPSSFEPVDATDMVNLLTGDFTYVMPILDVPSPEGGYPLSLAYHAGISADQNASWTGLGWNINPGAINRNLLGLPDDHDNFKRQDVYYNLIDEYSNFTVSINYGTSSHGLGISYSTHKGFGGSVNYGPFELEYDNGFSAGVGLSILKVAAGTAGDRTDVFQTNVSVGINYNFKNKETSGGVGATNSFADSNISSVGLNFSSSSGVSSSASVFGATAYNGGSVSNGIVNSSYSGWTVPIPTPITGLTINLSNSKVKHWVYSNNLNYGVGSLAFNRNFETVQAQHTNDYIPNVQMSDVMIQPINPYELGTGSNIPNSVYSDITNEINLPTYDRYQVNAQGMGGDFSIRYYQDFPLPLGKRGALTKQLDTGQNDEPLWLRRQFLWEKKGEYKPHFYFNNEYASYLEIAKDNPNSSNPTDTFAYWDTNNINNNNSITQIDQYSEKRDVYNGNVGYVGSLKRKKTGGFIQAYKKSNLTPGNSEAAGFMYATNNNSIVDYNEIYGTTDSDYSVIGFNVTAIDGKTYHYSLPVYQKELISKVAKNNDESNKFNESRDFSSYATNWLLTSVTGPDFIDLNDNKFPDENDYGYWVRFEYGKWSEGFGWETLPNRTYTLEGDNCDDPLNNPSNCNTVAYNNKSFGVKELYYLNKIKTRTHSALFLKSTTSIGRGKNLSEGNSRQNPKIYNNVRKFHNVATGQQTITTGTFRSYYDVVAQNTMQLDKIVLLNNEDDIYSSADRPINKVYGGEFFFEESFDKYSFNGSHLGFETKTVHEST